MMTFVKKFGQQPKSWILFEALFGLLLVAGVDLITTWQFSMFIFYSLLIYVVALHLPRRWAIGFTFLTVVVSTVVNLDSIGARGVGGYVWGSLNRLG